MNDKNNDISETVKNEGRYGFHSAERKCRYFESLSTKQYKKYNLWTFIAKPLTLLP